MNELLAKFITTSIPAWHVQYLIRWKGSWFIHLQVLEVDQCHILSSGPLHHWAIFTPLSFIQNEQI